MGRQRGFTMIEMILTVVLLGIIAGVVGRLLLVGLDTYAAITIRTAALQQARLAIQRMTDELVRLPMPGLLSATETRLDFLDGDGALVNFRQAPGGAEQIVLRNDDLLANHVGFLDFDLKDANGAATLLPELARRINVELNLLYPGGGGSITLRSEVFPRAFMYMGFK